MGTIARVLVILVLVAVSLPASIVRAAAPPADPICVEIATQLGAQSESVMLNGAVTCLITPPPARWNRDVVIFAHGYVDARQQPVAIPWDQVIRDETNLPALLTKLGYAFATTSYQKSGLAVKEGVADVVSLAQYIRTGNSRVRRIYLTGASEGGLVTALAIERYPKVFAGGLSTCGPVGSFVGQVQYWGNFRVTFDKYFPALLAAPVNAPIGPSTPVYIDPTVIAEWETLSTGYLAPALAADPAAVQALLTETGVPINPAKPVETAGESILGLLYYNIEATNNARMTLNPATTPDQLPPPSLAGNPYKNLEYVSVDYPAGLQTDPVALAEIASYYETTARLSRPLVLMHTTGDPIIPFWQPLQYLDKALRTGRFHQTAFLPVNRYGHCTFTAPELVLGFYTMVLRATRSPFSATQIQAALPDPAQRAEFEQLKQDR